MHSAEWPQIVVERGRPGLSAVLIKSGPTDRGVELPVTGLNLELDAFSPGTLTLTLHGSRVRMVDPA